LVQQVAEPFRAFVPEDTLSMLVSATRRSTVALPSVATITSMLH
jgi:hypothetical protein